MYIYNIHIYIYNNAHSCIFLGAIPEGGEQRGGGGRRAAKRRRGGRGRWRRRRRGDAGVEIAA